MDTSPDAADIGKGYVELCSRLRADGLMDRRYSAFVIKGIVVLAAVASGWVAVVFIGRHWAALGVAAGLGLVSTQVVFFGHDAGHHQIFAGARGNRLVGLVAGNLLTGLSYGWWEPKHNAHHAHPNQIGKDPDIGPGAVAFTADAAARRRGLGRFALRRQAWTFFPLLTLEGINLRISSVQSVWRRRHDRRAWIEGALIAAHLIIYSGLVFWAMPPLEGLVFIAVQQAAFGIYLGSCFAPNHKGMPALSADAKVPFAERQVVTARNVRGGRVVTFLLGGLNYQIEHHLFPKMPMANLRRSQAHVQEFCRNHGLTYRQDGIVRSYRTSLAHLKAIGRGALDPVHEVPMPDPVAA